MDIRPITDRYHVAPQIDPADAPALAAAGFTRVICNRPDAEVPPSLQAAAVGEAVRAAGMDFELLPLTHQTMTAENVAKQASLVEDAPGKVLAYCASGTRCSVIWALGQAGKRPTDEILAATARAGYALDGLRPALEAAARD
ncbi:MAG: TIGR01244 family sulfur transferase [Paracoccaceae bacterium]